MSVNSDTEPLLPIRGVPSGGNHVEPGHIYAIEVVAAPMSAASSFLYLLVAIEFISSASTTSPGPGCIVQRMVHRDKDYTIAVITAVGVLGVSWLAAVVAGRFGGHSGITQHSTYYLLHISPFFFGQGGSSCFLFVFELMRPRQTFILTASPLTYANVRFTVAGGNRLQCSVGY